MNHPAATPTTAVVKVLWICVSYCSDSLVPGCLASISRSKAMAPDVQLKCVLVDNTERADSSFLFERSRFELPGLVTLKTAENLGYFGAASYAVEFLSETLGSYTFVIVSNVDLTIEEGFLPKLSTLPIEPELGVIAPSIHSMKRGADRNPHLVARPSPGAMKRFVSIHKNYFVHNFHELLSFGFHQVKKLCAFSSVDRSSNRDLVREIYAPHGSLMIFSNRYFDCGSSLEYPCFLYGEEIFVAESARRSKLKILYVPSLRVCHVENVSTGIIHSRRIHRHIAAQSSFNFRHYFDGTQEKS